MCLNGGFTFPLWPKRRPLSVALYPMEDPEFSRTALSVCFTSTSLWVVTAMTSWCPFGHPTPLTEMQVFVTSLPLRGYFILLLSKTLSASFLTVNLGSVTSSQIRSLNRESEKLGPCSSLATDYLRGFDIQSKSLWNESMQWRFLPCFVFFPLVLTFDDANL